MKEIETVESRVVYRNRWMQLREDKIRRQSGAEGIYGVVEKPDFVVIIPIQGEHIHLVQQYRYPVGSRQWELPQGAWEGKPDADPLLLARGELEEETGLQAGAMVYVGYQYLAYGMCDQGYHIFLATDLQPGVRKLDEEEEGLITQAFSLKAFEGMLISGEIQDATTSNAYGLARLKGFLK